VLENYSTPNPERQGREAFLNFPATFPHPHLYYNIDMAVSGDQALVKRTLTGDLDAFGELIQLYQSSVFNVCYRVLGDRQNAEDQTQEAFLRAYKHLNNYDPDRPFGPWMRTLAANLCYNELKRKDVIQVPLEDERDITSSNPAINPEHALEISQENRALYQAIWELPPPQRIALELRHFQGLTYREMAEAMKLPLNTVRSHLYRGRQNLAELLEAADDE
jgi:RNA polymerase sigma-70 factor (ECF subfamily)